MVRQKRAAQEWPRRRTVSWSRIRGLTNHLSCSTADFTFLKNIAYVMRKLIPQSPVSVGQGFDPMPRSGRRFLFLVALILLSILVLFPFQKVNAPVHSGTLDQQQTVVTFAMILSGPPAVPEYWGQTFTAGLTGSLTEVDLVIACYTVVGSSCESFGPVVVEIHSGSPTGALLGSSSLVPGAIPILIFGGGLPSLFVPFSFSPSPAVVAGSVYAIVITTTNAPASGSATYEVGGADSTGNAYAAGDRWYCVGSSCSWTSDPQNDLNDLAFETYVTPPVIPEYPLGLPLLAIFMVLAYVVIRRKTSQKNP
jgi:hypothetical protein